jgi:hypothetical protein
MINIGKFHSKTSGQTFIETVNRELGRKFPGVNFKADYFVGDAEKKIGVSNVYISKRGVTSESVIRVELADGCRDQVLAMLEDSFQAELEKPKFASVKELIAVS